MGEKEREDEYQLLPQSSLLRWGIVCPIKLPFANFLENLTNQSPIRWKHLVICGNNITYYKEFYKLSSVQCLWVLVDLCQII